MTYCIPLYLRRVFLSRLSRISFSFFSGFARSSGSLIKIPCKLSVVQVGEISNSFARLNPYIYND